MSERTPHPSAGQPAATKTPPPKLATALAEVAERGRNVVKRGIERLAQDDAYQVVDPAVVAHTFQELALNALNAPEAVIKEQLAFWDQMMLLGQRTLARALSDKPVEPVIEPAPDDRRFQAPAWNESLYFDFLKQSYLLASRHIQAAVRQVEGLDPQTARKAQFFTRQLIDALAPTNTVIGNPEVLKATVASEGENLVRGLGNLIEDLERGKGRLDLRMTDLSAFKLGENIAVTPGKVVYQNELMQLIQYAPATETVAQRPLLIVPPWINKFYILDLKPKNSFIKWAVDQGFTVFVISWVNPDQRLAAKSFADYLLEGPLAALDAIEQATGEREANVIGYCIGGTLTATTLAYMAAKQDARIASATFFTSLLDFTDVGELAVFIDEEQLGLLDRHMERLGYLEGRHMAAAFNLLRENELIWSFVINNYLFGRDPRAFDLLYWNSDSTRMPAAMHHFYLRNMYQRNLLREPGGIVLAGVPIDLARIKIPTFFLSTREDHIAPWRSTYAGARLLSGPVRFVLGGSGHIAGVINPPEAKKYGYWTNDALPPTPEAWLEAASHHAGSWWGAWKEWVAPFAGPQVPARRPGEGRLAAIEDAPGSYVQLRVSD